MKYTGQLVTGDYEDNTMSNEDLIRGFKKAF
jgi:hypothetical protein